MARLLQLTLFLVATSICAITQTVDATTCEILANPQSYDGKIVRVKATVTAGFDEFVLKDESCNQPINAVWLSYPEGTKGKAGPLAVLQVQVARTVTLPSGPPQRSLIK